MVIFVGGEVTSQRINNDCFLMGERKKRGEERKREEAIPPSRTAAAMGHKYRGEIGRQECGSGRRRRGRGGRGHVAVHVHAQRRHDSACGAHSCLAGGMLTSPDRGGRALMLEHCPSNGMADLDTLSHFYVGYSKVPLPCINAKIYYSTE